MLRCATEGLKECDLYSQTAQRRLRDRIRKGANQRGAVVNLITDKLQKQWREWEGSGQGGKAGEIHVQDKNACMNIT